MNSFQNMYKQPSQWAGGPVFYPDANVSRGFYSAAGDAFDATTELQKLQKGCYAAYPDGVIKGYHKGHAKAYNKCMSDASTTINTLIKENTKLTTESAFNSAVTSALGTSSVASGTGAVGDDSSTMFIAAIAILFVVGGGYYLYSKNKAQAATEGAPAPAPAPAAV